MAITKTEDDDYTAERKKNGNYISGIIIRGIFSREGFISLDFIPNAIEVKRICMHNERD